MFPDASYKPFGAQGKDMERELTQENGQDLECYKASSWEMCSPLLLPREPDQERRDQALGAH